MAGELFNTAIPGDNDFVAPSAGNLRTNALALERVISAEHELVAGADLSTQTGRHKFGRGTTAQRNAITDWREGSIWFNTDDFATTGYLKLQHYDLGAATWRDVLLVDANAARLDIAKGWTSTQYAAYVAMGTSGSGPMNLTFDATLSPMWKHTLTENSLLANPSPEIPLGSGAFLTFVMTQDGGGTNTLSFGSKWVPAGQGQPSILTGANEVSVIQAQVLPNQDLLYWVNIT